MFTVLFWAVARCFLLISLCLCWPLIFGIFNIPAICWSLIYPSAHQQLQPNRLQLFFSLRQSPQLQRQNQKTFKIFAQTQTNSRESHQHIPSCVVRSAESDEQSCRGSEDMSQRGVIWPGLMERCSAPQLLQEMLT